MAAEVGAGVDPGREEEEAGGGGLGLAPGFKKLATCWIPQPHARPGMFSIKLTLQSDRAVYVDIRQEFTLLSHTPYDGALVINFVLRSNK